MPENITVVGTVCERTALCSLLLSVQTVSHGEREAGPASAPSQRLVTLLSAQKEQTAALLNDPTFNFSFFIIVHIFTCTHVYVSF